MIGAPVFLRESLAHSRRTRTYVFQTIFLAVLVLALIPLWPSSGKQAKAADIASTGRLIFEWAGYLQVILLALLAPATVGNAITQEKDKNTLDLLLLSEQGPFAIVWGKFFSRLLSLVFLLFLTIPLLFALLTLGGVSGATILIEFTTLVSFAVFCTGLGIFLSTILPKATSVLMTGYVLLAGLLVLPVGLEEFGVVQAQAGCYYPVVAAYLSPLHDLIYLFKPSHFVKAQSFPEAWWICPLWTSLSGVGLAFIAGLLLPYARVIERVLNLRRLLEAVDSASYLLLHPRALLRTMTGGARGAKESEAARPNDRRLAEQNPIYWKETSVNTIGRFRYWWRVNLGVLAVMGGTYAVFSTSLSNIEFHKYTVAALTGIIVLLSTVIAATTVSQEREDGSLVLLATTPIGCKTYVYGKVRGIFRNIMLLVGLPFLHVVIFCAAGIVHPVTIVYLLLAIPVAVVASVMQGVFVSLLFPTTLRAIIAGITVVILESALPLVCCLPTFNLPATCYYMVEPMSGLGSLPLGAGSGTSYLWAMFLALVFSAGTQIGYTVVVFSLIRSGFDRYIGRAA